MNFVWAVIPSCQNNSFVSTIYINESLAWRLSEILVKLIHSLFKLHFELTGLRKSEWRDSGFLPLVMAVEIQYRLPFFLQN